MTNNPKRRAMTKARKLRIWNLQDGSCGCGCGEPVDQFGPNVRYDHTISFFIAPELDDDGPNVKAVRTACDAPKTYGSDLPTIAKVKRLHKRRVWTFEDDRLLAENAALGIERLTKLLERSETSINSRASRLSIRLGRCHETRMLVGIPGFMDRVEFDPNGGCWLWSGGKNLGGYGGWHTKEKYVLAHRASWHFHHGPIPDGLFVCHKCDVRLCVNPDHLFLGTAEDNTQDMLRKGRRPSCAGELCANAKLTAEQVLEINKDSRPLSVIARAYGVSKGAISGIKYGDNWSSVTGKAKPNRLRSRGFHKHATLKRTLTGKVVPR